MLRVVGVGGAGVNAINRMVEAEIEGVEFLAINTDLQSLQQSAAHETLHIGDAITHGLGSGSNPELGRAAAREEYDRIKAMLRGSDMVFIAAGAGGGTGTGAAPIVAQIARELGALTVGIVTRPFQFEGTRRRDQAEAGIADLAEEVDTLIVVPNNRLLSVLERNVSMVEAFRVADDVLRQGVQGISDLVTLPGLINLDFADVRTIMSGAGTALLGIGMGTGDRRAIEAAEQAVASPLLETSMEGAHSILLSITGGPDLSLWEVNESAKAVAEAAHPDANIIFGAMVDEKLQDNVWVTVIATGYGDGRARRRDLGRERRALGRACSGPRPVASRAGRRAARQPRAAALRDARPRRARVHPSQIGPAGRDGRAARRDRRRPSAVRAGRRRRDAEGGNAVDCALAAMLTSFACEPLLTSLGAGGYMLVVEPGEEPVLLDFFVEAPGRGADVGARAQLVPISVSFGDAVQVFNIGPASVGTYGMAAGVCEASSRFGRIPLADLVRPAASLARDGVELNTAQAYVIEILAGIVTSTPECAALFAPGRARGRGPATSSASRSWPTRSSGWAARAPRRSSRGTSRRRSSTGWRSAAGSSPPRTWPRTRSSTARRSGSRTAGARSSPTRRRRPAGS